MRSDREEQENGGGMCGFGKAYDRVGREEDLGKS